MNPGPWLVAAMVALGVAGVPTAPAFAQDDAPADAPAETTTMDEGSPEMASDEAPEAEAVPAEDAAAAAEAPAEGGGGYVRELRTIEQRVSGLKERVFQSKATLELLRELVIEGGSIGATLRIVHADQLNKAYQVESLNYFLDGRPIWSWQGGEGEEPPDEVEVRDEGIQSGEHALQVSAVVRGNGDVFPYLSDYRVTVESSYAFDVAGGSAMELTVRLVSKGGVRKRFIERPTVVYEERNDTSGLE